MQQTGAALGVAITGVVFFGVVGADFTRLRLEDALATGAWVPIAGYLVSAAATVLLPSRAQVHAHVAEQEVLVDA
jgi:hypothetical protein